jgi:hypothetical protein
MAFTLDISLPEPLKTFVEAETRAGDYETPVQFITEVIRDYRDRGLGVKERLLKSLKEENGSLEVAAEDWEHGDIVGLVEEHAKILR